MSLADFCILRSLMNETCMFLVSRLIDSVLLLGVISILLIIRLDNWIWLIKIPIALLTQVWNGDFYFLYKIWAYTDLYPCFTNNT